MSGVEISITVGLELRAFRNAVQSMIFLMVTSDYNRSNHSTFVVNLSNKYVLILSTGRFYFVQV